MSVAPLLPSVVPSAAAPVIVPDLLHSEPALRIDAEHTKLAIGLAFAGGTSGGLFAEALDKATVARSSWDPKAFANDLFLSQFVALCFRIRVRGRDAVAVSANHLVRVISQPPANPAIAEHRRAILRELVGSPLLRAELERLHATLGTFRAQIEGGSGLAKWDANRRQIEILQSIKEVIDICAESFAAAQSGLSRLARFGERIRATEAYGSLADLLRYDERLATLNLKIGVGADGRIRGFEVLSVQEDSENPFVSSPLRRWLGKIELFVRGFKLSDGEVMARLIDAVFEGIHEEVIHLVQLLGDVELYLGALGFHDIAADAGLAVCLPTFVPASAPRSIEGLFNPLLLVHGVRPTPCNVSTDRHAATVLVTGPNSGGKTRLLQSIALTQLLAQGGLFVPARSASLTAATGLVVSLIEEAKADQSEGRLGTELMRIRDLFERLPPGAMVLLDELCSGTNPSEGEEIFELVVQMLTQLSPQAFITTHFLAFAARLERERQIDALRFLQVELGPGHRPTYQFVPGVATTSLASQAASRLGVTRDQLLALIERNAASHGPRT